MSDTAKPDDTCDALIERIEQALFQRAIGLEVETVEVVQEGEKKRTKLTRKKLPPDLPTARFILINLRRNKWRSKPPPPEPAEKIILIHPIVLAKPTDEPESM